MTKHSNVIDELEKIFTTNIEHDGSYIPVSAIREKLPELEALIQGESAESYRRGYAAGNGKKNYRKRADQELYNARKRNLIAQINKDLEEM